GLGALDRGEVALAVQLDEECPLLDPLPLDDAEPLDLGADVGADLDLGAGLDPAGGVDLLDDLLPAHPGGLDLDALVAAPARGHAGRDGGDHHEAGPDPEGS